MQNRMTQLLNSKYTAEQRAAVLIDYFANNGDTLPCSGFDSPLLFKSGIIVIPSTQVTAPLRYFWEGLCSNFFGDFEVEINTEAKGWKEAGEELSSHNPGATICWEDVMLQYVLLGHPLLVDDHNQVIGQAKLYYEDILANFVKAVGSNNTTELALRWLQEFQVCQHDAFVTDGFLQFCIYGDLIFG